MNQLQKITSRFSTLLGLIIGLLVLPISLISQTGLSIGDIYSCSNTEVKVPVHMENFKNVAAYTIFIGIDVSNIEYIDVEDINEVFSNGSFVYNFMPQQQAITFNWTSLAGVTIDEGLLCNLKVKIKEDQSSFTFLPNCEIVTADLSIIEDVTYVNGNTAAFNSIQPDPVSQSLSESSHATIELHGLNDDVSYQWQINTGDGWSNLSDNSNYSGVQTSMLDILSVTKEMDNTYYRSLIISETCSEASVTSELFVTINALDENNVKGSMLVYPVPATNQLNCSFNSSFKDAELRLENLYGELVLTKNIGHIESGESIPLSITNIVDGVYILRLTSGNTWISNNKIIIH